jgi:alcohol dehydrogenase, propanol-preferring
MKAFQLLNAGEMGQLRDVPVPSPASGEVLIKVAGAGLCQTDLYLMQAGFPPLPYLARTPFTLGHEPAGWVEQVGPGVAGLERGMPVVVYPALACGMCRACHAGEDQLCELSARTGPTLGMGCDGAIAEYMLVRSVRQIIPLGQLDPREAAPLTDAALAPYRAIRRNLDRLRPDASVVVIGIGGLGHMAVQLLRAMCSAQIIAVDCSLEKVDLARALGADVAIMSDQNAAGAIREATRGHGAAVVLDLVGLQATLKLAASVVRVCGRIVVIGMGGGTLPWHFLGVPFEASLATSYLGNPTELREVVALAEAGRIQVHIEAFELEQTAQAYQLLQQGRIRGRAIVTPHG